MLSNCKPARAPLPAAVLCCGFFCNASCKDGVGPLNLWLCNTPWRHTEGDKHTCLLDTSANIHARTCYHAHRHYIKVFARTNHHTHTHMQPHTRTHIKPDCAVTRKGFAAAVLAGWLFAKGQSWLQITAGGRPRLVIDLNALCVYPHTCTPTDGRDGSTAESTQPFCNTSRNFPSSPCMRNRWGGAIKWICCYFPRLLAEDVKPQPLRQPRMTADSGRGKHIHTTCTRTKHSAMHMISFYASV